MGEVLPAWRWRYLNVTPVEVRYRQVRVEPDVLYPVGGLQLLQPSCHWLQLVQDVVVHVHLETKDLAFVEGRLQLQVAPPLALVEAAWDEAYLLGERGVSRALRLPLAAA